MAAHQRTIYEADGSRTYWESDDGTSWRMVGQAWPGPWWCPGCSTSTDLTMSSNHGGPACVRCGTPLEEQGTGDDDPWAT